MNNEGCVAGNLDSTDGTGWKDFPHADYTDDADLEEDRLCMEDGNLTGLRELTLLTGIPPKKRGFMWTTT